MLQLYIAVPNEEGKSDMIPVAGVWSDCAAELGLQTPGKNPMSLVMDREKLIVSRSTRDNLILVWLHGWNDCRGVFRRPRMLNKPATGL